MGQLHRLLASFRFVGVIWLNHLAVFARVCYCDRSLHLANLFLLLTSALIPFPTAVLSAAIQSGSRGHHGSSCFTFSVRKDGVEPDFFPKERFGRHSAFTQPPAWPAGSRPRRLLCPFSWRCRCFMASPARV
jgi:hypothetical protein